MTKRWIGFIVTTAANATVFTPMSDASQDVPQPLDWWEERWENYPAVGNYGVVDDPRLADKIVTEITLAGFDIVFADQRK